MRQELAAKLPPPVGNVWIIPANKGEWHVLTEKGFYLARLFEGNLTKNAYMAAKEDFHSQPVAIGETSWD